MRTPGVANHRHPLVASQSGIVAHIDNRKLAKLAKLAGAPETKAAGVEMHVRLGDAVTQSEPLCTVNAESKGELQYALDYAALYDEIFQVEPS